MKTTTDYWVNEWLKLYFVGYPNKLIEKIIHERRNENESRTSSKSNLLSSTFTR